MEAQTLLLGIKYHLDLKGFCSHIYILCCIWNQHGEGRLLGDDLCYYYYFYYCKLCDLSYIMLQCKYQHEETKLHVNYSSRFIKYL